MAESTLSATISFQETDYKNENMSIERSVIQKILSLTPDQQREVMEFVESLQKGPSESQPRRSLMGIFSDLNVHITEEDIAEARREMWGNFPREDI